jgi:tRNA1Val (adenine37-N6)-methyltransferase
MGNTWFQFKQFHIEQERTALKVGTDGVLLGAWCMVQEAKHILDVGTGTGLIALMLAQRSEAEITAIEIDENAFLEANSNFKKSPWSERLQVLHGDFNQLLDSTSKFYDLVVCNPPFFKNSLKSADAASSLARHDVTLSFLQLIRGSRRLLHDHGKLAVILPFEATIDFRETARMEGFYLSRQTNIIPRTGKPAKRVLMEFSRLTVYPDVNELVILCVRDKYSEGFIELTKDFYLNVQS